MPKAKAKKKAKKKAAKVQPSRWQSRIIGQGYEAPDQLLANPSNWRIHPEFQQKALEGILDEIGWVQNVIVNKTTEHIVDGHLRVMLALRHDEPHVPVLYVELSPEEEKKALLALDPIAALAVADEEQVHRLQMEVETSSEALRAALNDIVPREQMLREARTRDDDVIGFIEEPDLVFRSDNDWGIPALSPEDLASDDCVPETTWDGGNLEDDYSDTCMFMPYDKMGWFGDDRMKPHVINFYIDDKKFEVLWNNPRTAAVRLLRAGAKAVVQPDYSLWDIMPFAVQLYNVYRSYWVAAYWQRVGLPVIPNILIGTPNTREFCMAAMPKEPPIVSFQCRTTGQEKERYVRGQWGDNLNLALNTMSPDHCICYGGTDHPWLVKYLPAGPIYHLVPSYTETRRWMMNAEQRAKYGDPPTRMSGTPSELAVEFHAKGVELD